MRARTQRESFRSMLLARMVVLAAGLLSSLSAFAVSIVDAGAPHIDRGVYYSQTLVTGSGGTAPYTFTATTASLPAQMTLTTGGVLYGTTCGTNGNYSVPITVTDSLGATASSNIQVIVNRAPAGGCSLTFSTSATLTSGVVGSGYSQTIAATGGTSPYTYTLTSSSLPSGLSLSSGGAISGTPSAAGSYSFSVTATDASGATGVQTFSLTIASSGSSLALSVTASSNTQVGVAYSQTSSASGGTSPYTFAISAGSLPAGLTLNTSTGTVSGTPTTAGAFSYTVRVTDNASATATQVVSGTIAAATLTLSVTASSNTQVGVAYSQTSSASGGTSPYTFAISAGSLPAGLTLNISTGTVSGTPTTAGAFSYTVRVTDAASATATQTVAGTMATAAITIGNGGLSGAIVGANTNQPLPVAGGVAPYTYALSGGSLPPGVSLGTDGHVHGVPTAPGTYTFTVTVTDSASPTPNAATLTYTITVAARPDPTKNPGVMTLLNEQAGVAQRFVATQLGHFQSHLRDLHGNTSARCESAPDNNTRVATKTDPTLVTPDSVAADKARALAIPVDACKSSPDATAMVWSSGSIEFGDTDARAGGDGFRFHSSGVTAGVDVALTPKLRVGGGLGASHDRSNAQTEGVSNSSNALALAGYASFKPLDRLFLDAVVGFGYLSFDTTRPLANAGDFATGSRRADQWFVSVAATYRIDLEAVTWLPYLRVDGASTTLRAYNESAPTTEGLHYENQRVPRNVLVAGSQLQTSVPTAFGRLSPKVALEYRHEYEHTGNARLRYADQTDGPFYSTPSSADARDTLALDLGAQLTLPGGWNASLTYGFDRANFNHAYHVNAAVSRGF